MGGCLVYMGNSSSSQSDVRDFILGRMSRLPCRLLHWQDKSDPARAGIAPLRRDAKQPSKEIGEVRSVDHGPIRPCSRLIWELGASVTSRSTSKACGATRWVNPMRARRSNPGFVDAWSQSRLDTPGQGLSQLRGRRAICCARACCQSRNRSHDVRNANCGHEPVAVSCRPTFLLRIKFSGVPGEEECGALLRRTARFIGMELLCQALTGSIDDSNGSRAIVPGSSAHDFRGSVRRK